ncbi:MAG: HAD family phosphatase [Defluviitaleaceae bacterium]|nr:HAD family phosphatase [Defluviitaleaceae bacterium]
MSIAVIFDMDGVLIDSQPLHYAVDIRVLKACGHPATIETVTPYTGIGNPDRWPKYKEDLNLSQEVDELIAMTEEAMRDIFSAANLPLIDGVALLIDGIKAMGIRIGVASSSPPELISLILQKTGIADKFDFIVSGEDVSEGKPSPEIYLRAAEKAGFPPEKCVAIEDAPVGILAAKNAGITCIAYKNPGTIGQDFTNATYVIDKFDDAFPIIKTLFFRVATGMSL